jgi:hypothetical protein
MPQQDVHNLRVALGRGKMERSPLMLIRTPDKQLEISLLAIVLSTSHGTTFL